MEKCSVASMNLLPVVPDISASVFPLVSQQVFLSPFNLRGGIEKHREVNQRYSDLLPAKTVLSKSKKPLSQNPGRFLVLRSGAGMAAEAVTPPRVPGWGGTRRSTTACGAQGSARCLRYRDHHSNSFVCLAQYS